MKRLFLILTVLAPPVYGERAKVDTVTGEVLAYEVPVKDQAPPNPAVWYPVTREAKPPFDPATEKLVRQVNVDQQAETVTVNWNVVALTQAELDARAADAQAASDEDTRRTQIQNVMDQLNAGTLTGAQVQQVLYRLLKNLGYGQ